jgi:hypothetical protein
MSAGSRPEEPWTQLADTIRRLEAYCRNRQWAGYDPYDALNSEVFGRTPLAKSRLARLALTQFLKRSPVNLRPLLRIQPRQDPKAIALFLMSYVRLARRGDEASRVAAVQLANRLLELRSPETPYWCWGYSFPWQMRDRLVPRFGPNLVCTTFAANALLDACEMGLGDEFLTPAVSAGQYVRNELYWSAGRLAGFAYPLPDIRVPIHNANFLGAALLCRLAKLTGQRSFLDTALAVARYSAGSQREDGSWPYGVAPTQQWVDNFHTGYNLCALQSIAADLGGDEFEPLLRKGVAFYLRHFFTARGAPRYFHNLTHPIDIHCVAQSLITLMAFRRFDPSLEALARSVLAWAMAHMWDERGYFYYRLLRGLTIRTPYMRWSQAWMLLALVALASEGRRDRTLAPCPRNRRAGDVLVHELRRGVGR